MRARPKWDRCGQPAGARATTLASRHGTRPTAHRPDPATHVRRVRRGRRPALVPGVPGRRAADSAAWRRLDGARRGCDRGRRLPLRRSDRGGDPGGEGLRTACGGCRAGAADARDARAACGRRDLGAGQPHPTPAAGVRPGAAAGGPRRDPDAGQDRRPTALDRAARRASPWGSFAATKAAPERIVLVDDVRTTGATVSAAGSVLRAAGARQVLVATLAVAGRSPGAPAGVTTRQA